MIPPNFSPTTPRGERDLFQKLEKDPHTKDWVVFHSLDIKKHRTKIEGELDMVVLVPGHGILCIEVKGCDVKRIDGEWIYSYPTSRSKSLEGPFKQASKAMHSLRDYIKSKDTSLENLLFFSCVIFTNVDFEEDSPEWHSWQYINARTFYKNPISANLLRILGMAKKHTADKVGGSSWFDDKKSCPTIGQIDKIVSLIREDFEYAISPRRMIEQAEQRIIHFTEEQYEALDLLQENQRVLFKGPAGTGKTFIAIEQFRRMLKDGSAVLFLCFNKLLGDWLKIQTDEIGTSNSKCGTFHSLLLEITKEKPAKDSGKNYWDTFLPDKAFECLVEDPHPNKYDFIILDEAQDLIKDQYLDVLDLLLKGGLAGGRWAFFGDFERQAIYLDDLKQGADKALSNLKQRSPNFATYSLRINCRNAEAIAETLTFTSGLTPGYKKVLNDIEDGDASPYFYKSEEEQQALLSNLLIEVKRLYKPTEIVILSMNDDSKSCAGKFTKNNLNLEPIRSHINENSVAYGSVHSFKGLEAPVVILTDIESLVDERDQSLLYIGMSRARIRLCILMHENCRQKYMKLLDVGFALSAEN